MYTRVIEVTCKSGKINELTNTIHEKVLPILRKQTGFVDDILLTSDTNPDKVMGISFWNSKEEADRCHSEHYSRIGEMLSPLTEGPPNIRTFNVQSSSAHKIAGSKAA